MSDIELETLNPRQTQRIEHQTLDLEVTLNTGMPVNFRADLQGLA